jgi:hypothetical protein
MSPTTLRSLERGGSGVTIGANLAAMQALRIERDIDLLAKADPAGRAFQDAQLPAVRTQTRKSVPLSSETLHITLGEPKTPIKATEAEHDWMTRSGFTSFEALTQLIDP